MKCLLIHAIAGGSEMIKYFKRVGVSEKTMLSKQVTSLSQEERFQQGIKPGTTEVTSTLCFHFTTLKALS
jgi:hypothetical protein